MTDIHQNYLDEISKAVESISLVQQSIDRAYDALREKHRKLHEFHSHNQCVPLDMNFLSNTQSFANDCQNCHKQATQIYREFCD